MGLRAGLHLPFRLTAAPDGAWFLAYNAKRRRSTNLLRLATRPGEICGLHPGPLVRQWLLVALLLASACASPSVRVERVDGRRVHEELTRNVLSTGELSAPSRALLVRLDSYREFRRRPEAVLGELHAGLTAGGSDRLFVLAEASILARTASLG